MANQLSKVTSFIISKLELMPLVNTIIVKDDEVYDVEKENIYPLVSLRLLPSPAPIQDLRSYVFEFEILNQRDYSPKPKPSKLMDDTNYIDNLGICDSIGNDFLQDILKSHNELDINIVEETITDFIPVNRDERNMMDGFKFQCTFTTHQNAV